MAMPQGNDRMVMVPGEGVIGIRAAAGSPITAAIVGPFEHIENWPTTEQKETGDPTQMSDPLMWQRSQQVQISPYTDLRRQLRAQDRLQNFDVAVPQQQHGTQHHPQDLLSPASPELPPHPLTSSSHAHYVHIGPHNEDAQATPSMTAPHYDTHSFANFGSDEKMHHVRQGELRVGQQLSEKTFLMHGEESLSRIVQEEDGEEVAYVPCRVASESGELFCYVKARLHSKATREEKRGFNEKLQSKGVSCEPQSSSTMTQTMQLPSKNKQVETSKSLLGMGAQAKSPRQHPQGDDVVYEPEVGSFLLIKDEAGRVLFEPVVEAQRATRGMLTKQDMEFARNAAATDDELVSYLVDPYSRDVGLMASPGREGTEPVSTDNSTQTAVLDFGSSTNYASVSVLPSKSGEHIATVNVKQPHANTNVDSTRTPIVHTRVVMHGNNKRSQSTQCPVNINTNVAFSVNKGSGTAEASNTLTSTMQTRPPLRPKSAGVVQKKKPVTNVYVGGNARRSGSFAPCEGVPHPLATGGSSVAMANGTLTGGQLATFNGVPVTYFPIVPDSFRWLPRRNSQTMV